MRALASIVLAVIAATGLGAAPAGAQSSAVTLSFQVKTESGAPVPQATVTIFDAGDDNFVRSLRADKDGRAATEMAVGVYRMTVTPSRPGPSDPPLAPATLYGVPVSADRVMDLTLAAGRLVDTAVVGAGGRPLGGARVEVYSDALALMDNVVADEDGWVRFVALPGQYAFVIPPADGGREMARWVRVSDLSVGASGFDRPLSLDALAAPEQTAPDVVRVHRGTAPGRHYAMAILAEGYTAASEPFVDENGNGRCDTEPFLDLNGDGRWADGEPYVDVNGNNRPDREPFTDSNGDGVCNVGERDKFFRDATDAARGFLGLPVYAGLREWIDVYAVFAASRQAGSDVVGAPAPLERDTAFGSKFYYPVYSADFDGAAAEVYLRDRAAADTLVLLTNDLFGLGRAFAGAAVDIFAGPEPEVATTLGHELGHTVASLSDEYFDYGASAPYTGPEPNTRNVTKSALPGSLKWSRFVRPSAQVPTADGTPGVGAFEGGRYRRRGLYRPAFNCLMRGPAPVFCAVCADAMQGRLAELTLASRPARPEINSPAPRSVVRGLATVSVTVLDPAQVDAASLFVDGAPVGMPTALAPFDLSLDADGLTPGRHQLAVELLLANGARVRTPVVEVTAQPRQPVAPSFAGATWRAGRLTLVGAANIDAVTARLVVNGNDRFPLEALPGGEIRTVKTGEGSASAHQLSKVLKKGARVTLAVRTPDGGASATVSFRR